MNRLSGNGMIAVATASIMAWFLFTLYGDIRQQQQRLRAPEESACPQSLEGPSTIEDFRTIPQDIGPFAAVFSQATSGDAHQQMVRQFRRQYFAPWTAAEPLFKLDQVAESVQQLAARTWYGENRLPVAPARMQQLLALADWPGFPSRDQSGVVIKPAFIRILPTLRPLYETPDDVPFDHLQFSEIKPNEPVRILHASKDEAWLYIETSYANGWVDPDAVSLVDASLRKRLTNAEQLVVVRDYSLVQAEQGRALPQPKIGTLYPLVKEEAEHWLVEVAVAGDDGHAALATARIAKGDARRHPLAFSPETVALIGNELLKTPYGWGELYRNRDCSATTRDFFLPFGVWLPRNSQKQITSGPFVPLGGLSGAEKEQRIRELGIPFRTILHHRGHIMLYIGLHDRKPIVLHTAWALRYKPGNCPERKFIVGRTIVSTLEAGRELSLAKGTMLDRLDGMLLLPVPEGVPSEKDPL